MGIYLFEEEPLTCEQLEKEVGLVQGSIKQMTTYPEGVVEIESDITMTTTQKDKIKAALQKRNLLKGKKFIPQPLIEKVE